MNNNQDKLISSAAKHLGTDPSTIKSAVESGSYDKLLNSMKPEDAAKIKNLLSDREKTERLMNSPQVKEFMAKLMGNKNG